MSSTSTTWTTDTNTKSGTVQVYESNVSVLRILGIEGGNAILDLFADQGDDNADKWRMWVNASDDDLHFANYTSGSWVNLLTIQDDGNVGIATSSPSEVFEVIGNIKSSGTGVFGGALTCATSLTIGSAAMVEADLEKLDGITNGTAAASKALVLDASKDIGTIRNLTIDGVFTDGNYTFDTGGNVSGLGTVGCGVITQSGATLAATYSPIAGGGNIVTTGALNSGSITSGFTSIDIGSGSLSTTGSVTLGATSFGDNNITNVGSIDLDSITSDGAAITIGGTPSIVLTDGTTVAMTLGTDDGDNFTINSTHLAVEGDTGRVGIGTASPDNSLHIVPVAGTVFTEGIKIERGNVATQYALLSCVGGVSNYTAVIEGGADGGGSHVFYTHDAGSGTPTARMSILGTGNVGIGTTTPRNRLDVINSAVITGRANFTMTGSIDVTGANVNVPGTDTKYTEELVIGDQILVGGETRTIASITNDTTATVTYAWGSDLGNDASPDCHPSAFTVLDAAGTAVDLIVNDDGNVGIGTAAPATRLTVKTPVNEPMDVVMPSSTNGDYTGIMFGSYDTTDGYRNAGIFVERMDNSDLLKLHFALDNAVDANNVDLTDSKMSIDYNGNVEIAGTGASSLKLLTLTNSNASGYGAALTFNNDVVSGGYEFAQIIGQASGTGGWLGFYTADTSEVLQQRIYIENDGDVGIGTAAPGQIFDVNSGGGNMIADGYDTHPSFFKYKQDLQLKPPVGFLEKITNTPIYKFKKKPFVSANEIKEAVLEEFGEDVLIEEAVEAQDAVLDEDGNESEQAIEAKDAVYEKRYSVWDELFPEDNSHRQKALYNMPDGDLKTWIDEWCSTKREERESLPLWNREYLGLIYDDSDTVSNMDEIFQKEDDGETVKSANTNSYIAMLHLAIQELSAEVEKLKNK